MRTARVVVAVALAVSLAAELHGQTLDWPPSLRDGQARLVRLKYAGGDWDQDMGKKGDRNLLLWYREVTGFAVAEQTEAVSAGELKGMQGAALPPFVLVTGRGRVDLDDAETAALREYCIDKGGMVVADNGGGTFDKSFRATVKRLFPDSPLVDIPVDDVLFRQPFQLPNGAPPLWHHSGTRAQGIRVGERWAVFYHQGDLLDAWKDGHSGASEEIANMAYRMGFNLLHYAYSHPAGGNPRP